MTKPDSRVSGMILACTLFAAPASGQPAGLPQLRGGLPQVPSAPLPELGRTMDGLAVPVDRVVSALPTPPLGRELLRRNRRVLEADELGRPVVRAEVAAVSLSAAALALAEAEGFRLKSRERLVGLDLDLAVLTPPPEVSATEALRRLRALDPQGQYDLNHLYFEGGAAGRTTAAPTRSGDRAALGRDLRIGLVDGSAATGVPALRRLRLVQRPFAPGGAKVSAHATAVASILAGDDGRFQGAAPGATLYVADVYGPTPVGGSAVSVARGLAWLAQSDVPVINISLVGPPNGLLAQAVQRLTAKGHILVAAVGNDGPAAPPLYPASYPGVVGVTGVDAHRRALPEAARGPQVDFAAPGSDLIAAAPRGGYVAVRGTSYAAPWVAALLARKLAAPDGNAARLALEAAATEAVDLGAAGPDPVFGRGGLALRQAVRAGAR